MLEPGTQTHSSLQTNGTLARRSESPATGADNLPDLLLIERARAGNEQAIEALIRRYSRRLFRVARSVIADDERAESIVQEAYLAAFADLSRYEPTGKFAAWLTRLTYQQARALRHAARFSHSAVAAAAPAAGAGEPKESQERHDLEHTIGGLPEVFRTVFVLRVVEGISGIETAASLGVHETTVRTRLYRAHRRLDADIVRRVHLQQGLLDVPAGRIERLANRVLAHLPRSSPGRGTAPPA